MKNLKVILAVAMFFTVFQSAFAAVTITGGSAIVTGSQVMGSIPDGSESGRSSTVNLSGSTLTSISDVQVVLHGSGTFTGDLYAYLAHDDGFTVLLNRIGAATGNDSGYSAAYSDPVRFSDGAANDVHFYQNQSGTGATLSGTWQPDGRKIDPGSSGSAFAAASRTANFGSFAGTKTGEGDWTLFVADMSTGEANTIDSWDLEITGVPEPVDYALMAFGGIFAAVQVFRYMKRQKVAASASTKLD